MLYKEMNTTNIETFIQNLSELFLGKYENYLGSMWHFERATFVKMKGSVVVDKTQRESDRLYYSTIQVSYADIWKYVENVLNNEFYDESTIEEIIFQAAESYGTVTDSSMEIL